MVEHVFIDAFIVDLVALVYTLSDSWTDCRHHLDALVSPVVCIEVQVVKCLIIYVVLSIVRVDGEVLEAVHIVKVNELDVQWEVIVAHVLHRHIENVGCFSVSFLTNMPAISPLWSKNRQSNDCLVLLRNFFWVCVTHQEYVSYSTGCCHLHIDLTLFFIVLNYPILSSCEIRVNSKPTVLSLFPHVEGICAMRVFAWHLAVSLFDLFCTIPHAVNAILKPKPRSCGVTKTHHSFECFVSFCEDLGLNKVEVIV